MGSKVNEAFNGTSKPTKDLKGEASLKEGLEGMGAKINEAFNGTSKTTKGESSLKEGL